MKFMYYLKVASIQQPLGNEICQGAVIILKEIQYKSNC